VFIDTNVLVYALIPGPRHEPCRDLMTAVSIGDLYGTTSTLVLEELWHLEGRTVIGLDPGSASDALEVFPEVLPVDEWVLQAAFSLGPPGRLGTANLLHAATCRAHRIDAIVTADQGFDDLTWLRRIEPDAQHISALLAAHP
jgi:predicted nucleic acid-binding protein